MTNDAKLGKATKQLIARADVQISCASIWEMTLKNVKGKLPLPDGDLCAQFVAQGFNVLPILPTHIEATRKLRCAYADPFDQIVLATAFEARLILLTRDAGILALGLDHVVAA